MNKNNNRANFYIFNHSNKAEHRATKFPPKMLNTVNPVYNEHPRVGPCIPNFFPNIRVEFRVGTSFRESGKVRKKLKKLVPTLIFGKSRKLQKSTEIFKIFPKFEKRQFPKLAKTKISEKKRLTQGLTLETPN